ncbi:hypothetical protein F5146DRAFT_1143258 [Armillaria mellea]|nr:hypothetical protein F5146DRAFT_1143258 [Armillaria mellea]
MDNELFANVTEPPAVIEALEKALFQALKEGQIVNYVIMASYMCMIYDAVLTFEDEVGLCGVILRFEFIWSFRFSKSSVLYIAMRYGNIIEEGISLAYAFWPGAPFLFCKVWYYIGEWVAYSLFIPTTIFLGLRTYALFHEKGPAYKWLIISLVAARINRIPNPTNPTLLRNIGNELHILRSDIYCHPEYQIELAMLLLYILLPKEHIQFRTLLITPLKCMCVIIASRIVLNIRKLVLHPTALTIDSLITPPEAAMYSAIATDVSSAMVFTSPQLPGSDDA